METRVAVMSIIVEDARQAEPLNALSGKTGCLPGVSVRTAFSAVKPNG